MKPQRPVRAIERISQYRRLLYDLKKAGKSRVCSHDLAGRIGGTAAQVRRDLMLLDCSCGSKSGYPVDGLLEKIGRLLDSPEGEKVAIVGVGNLGRALLAYFSMSGPALTVTAAFDVDPSKVGRVLHGCRCYGMEDMPRIAAEQAIRSVIMAVPAREVQGVADKAVECGVRGILNFAPVPLKVPEGVFVERIDMTVALEKVAFFARTAANEERNKV